MNNSELADHYIKNTKKSPFIWIFVYFILFSPIAFTLYGHWQTHTILQKGMEISGKVVDKYFQGGGTGIRSRGRSQGQISDRFRLGLELEKSEAQKLNVRQQIEFGVPLFIYFSTDKGEQFSIVGFMISGRIKYRVKNFPYFWLYYLPFYVIFSAIFIIAIRFFRKPKHDWLRALVSRTIEKSGKTPPIN